MKDARKYLEKYKRVDIAVDAYYGDPAAIASASPQRTPGPPAASTSKLNALFDKYKGEPTPPRLRKRGPKGVYADGWHA